MDLKYIVKRCYVFPYSAVPDLQAWLSLSPENFYVRYTFPSLNVRSWNERQRLDSKNLLVCSWCYQEKLKDQRKAENFQVHIQGNPLRTLDIFGGVGAFSRGLAEGSGCLKVTYAVEISPSAAKTFK